jgi:hypothetical protein
MHLVIPDLLTSQWMRGGGISLMKNISSDSGFLTGMTEKCSLEGFKYSFPEL